MDGSINDTLSKYVNNFTVKPSYYEQKPRILNHLTYIKKSKDKQGNEVYQRLRLKAAHKEVYMVISEIAGDSVCFRDISYIANMAGCSRDTVIEAKKVFQESFEQLDGKSLMTITEKRVMSTKKINENESKNLNKRPVHICGIEWIWEYNNAFMSALKECKDYTPPPLKQNISQKEAEISIERMGQKGLGEIVHKSGVESENRPCQGAESKNRPSPLGGRVEKSTGHKTPEQNPFVDKQNPTASLAESVKLSLINQKDVHSCFASEKTANEFLEVLGIKESTRESLLMKFNLNDMLSSVLYMQVQLGKKSLKGTVTGYFISILENRWFMPKLS